MYRQRTDLCQRSNLPGTVLTAEKEVRGGEEKSSRDGKKRGNTNHVPCDARIYPSVCSNRRKGGGTEKTLCIQKDEELQG